MKNGKHGNINSFIFETIFYQSPISTQIFSQDGQTLMVNKAWEKLWRITSNKIINNYNILQDTQLIEKGIMPFIKKAFAGEFVNIPAIKYEPEKTVPNLTKVPYRWVSAIMYPVKDTNGTIIYLVLQHEDITEQKEAEEKLRESEERFRATFHHTAIAMSIADINGNWFSFNKAYPRMFGYSKEELQTMHPLQLIHPSDKENSIKGYKQLIEGGIDKLIQERRYIHKNGNVIYGILHATVVRDTNGQAKYVVVAVQDITERKKAEEKLQQSEEKFRKLFDANIVGLFISDFDGKFLEANDALLSLIGYTREDLKKGIIHRDTLTPPQYKELSQKAVEALRTKGASIPYEKQYIRKDGKQISVLIAVARIDTSETCIGFVVDITDRKKLEKQKDEFMAVASHELKTPVTSLKAFAQILQKQFKKDGDTRAVDFLEKMDAQIDKLTTLISDLLDVSRIEGGKLQFRPERFYYNKLVDEIVEEVQRTTEHKIVIKKTKIHIYIYGDRERIGQVLTNLLTNALKYSPLEREIIVKIKMDKIQVITSVQDFGIGIIRDKQEHLFERFYRVSDPVHITMPGLGLGLYISSEILKRQNGKIWVESVEGKGSTFFFSLPIKD